MDKQKRRSSPSSSSNSTTMKEKRRHHHHSSDSDQYSPHHHIRKRHRRGDSRRDHYHHGKHKHKHSKRASSHSDKQENNSTITDNTQSDNDTLEKLKQLAKQYNKTTNDHDHKKRDKKKIKNSKYYHEYEEGSNKQRREAMVPQTKESYDKQRSVIRREYDPQTGRTRLVKGSGEVLESIVTGEQHRKINKQSTIQDGLSFQATIHNNNIK